MGSPYDVKISVLSNGLFKGRGCSAERARLRIIAQDRAAMLVRFSAHERRKQALDDRRTNGDSVIAL